MLLVMRCVCVTCDEVCVLLVMRCVCVLPVMGASVLLVMKCR